MVGHEAPLALLGRKLGVEVLQLLCAHKGDLTIQLYVELGIVPLELVERVANGRDDAADHILQVFEGAVLLANDLLPVPLVNVDGVQVIEGFVSADGIHVTYETLAHVEVVASERVALPFRE